MVSSNFAQLFVEVMRRHRKRAGLTQEALAERADLSAKTISFIERSERRPSLNVAHSIAHGLNVPLWELVKEADELASRKRQTR
jgi:transcriptional regulator with XRE-family HTH domain